MCGSIMKAGCGRLECRPSSLAAPAKTPSLLGLARKHIRLLMEESGETINLAAEDEAVYLAQVECR
jgi:DNA-binding IclR family transcriptional regulator